MTAHTTEAQVEAALRRNFGNITMAAAELGVTRQAVYLRVMGNERLQAAIVETEETMLDVAVAVAHKAVVNEDLPTTRWYLDRKGRSRGFGPQVGLSAPGGGPIQMRVQPVAPVLPIADLPDDARETTREHLQRMYQQMLEGASEE